MDSTPLESKIKEIEGKIKIANLPEPLYEKLTEEIRQLHERLDVLEEKSKV